MTGQDVAQVEVEEVRDFIVGKNNRFGIEAGTITPGVPEVVTSEDEDPGGNRVDTSKVITTDSRVFLKRKLESLKSQTPGSSKARGGWGSGSTVNGFACVT